MPSYTYSIGRGVKQLKIDRYTLRIARGRTSRAGRSASRIYPQAARPNRNRYPQNCPSKIV